MRREGTFIYLGLDPGHMTKKVEEVEILTEECIQLEDHGETRKQMDLSGAAKQTLQQWQVEGTAHHDLRILAFLRGTKKMRNNVLYNNWRLEVPVRYYQQGR